MAITFSDISGAQRWVGLGQARLIPSLQVIYDSTITGFRPVTPDDLGDAVSITGNVSIDDFISLTGITNVTGVVSFKNDSVVGITGFPLNVTGVVSFKENSQVGITGFPLNVTGVVSFKENSQVGITGFPLNVTGVISFKENSQVGITGFPLNITGVVNTQSQSTNIASNYTISGGNGICIYSNANRKSFYVQNLSTGNSLYIKLGTNAASDSFNYILKKDTGTDDGAGGTLTESSWKGNVDASGSAFVRYIAWELT